MPPPNRSNAAQIDAHRKAGAKRKPATLTTKAARSKGMSVEMPPNPKFLRELTLPELLLELKYDGPVWLRLPMEPAEAFALFTVYREAPSTRRSLPEVVEIEFQKSGRCPTEDTDEELRRRAIVAVNWRTQWKWDDRAEAYSAWKAEVNAEMWSDRRKQCAEQDWQSALKLLHHADLIEKEIERQGAGASAEIEEIEGSNRLGGKRTTKRKLIAPRIEKAVELREMASRLMRRAAGLDESTTKTVVEGSLLLKPVAPDVWTDEQLERARKIAEHYQAKRFDIQAEPTRVTFDAGDGRDRLGPALPAPSPAG
jgi:hypothetical protein